MAFTAGRSDKGSGAECPAWEGKTHQDGRLPGADMGSPEKTATHLRYIFNRMGFDDQEIVALSGAHGLGRCHETSSGFWGPWTRAPTTISNEYFRLLFELKGEVAVLLEGNPAFEINLHSVIQTDPAFILILLITKQEHFCGRKLAKDSHVRPQRLLSITAIDYRAILISGCQLETASRLEIHRRFEIVDFEFDYVG